MWQKASRWVKVNTQTMMQSQMQLIDSKLSAGRFKKGVVGNLKPAGRWLGRQQKGSVPGQEPSVQTPGWAWSGGAPTGKAALSGLRVYQGKLGGPWVGVTR